MARERRVPLVEQPAGELLSQDVRHPGLDRHGRQRADDGVRQHGRSSGTGVGFTRNPATGAKEFYGEFLINAQGEDVVAGIRTPQPIAELERVMPKAYKQLREITTRLEKQLQGHAGLRVHDPGRDSSTCCRPATASAPATRPS